MNKKKVIAILFIIPLLIYFWPTQLYGNTSYIMLLGESMTPTMESGALIVAQAEEKYFLGDVIAFVNEDKFNVVHRIVKETEEGFVTKGDNNRQNDPGFVTYDDILGRATFVLPYLGFTSLFLRTPLGLAIFGIFAVAMLVPKRSSKNKTAGWQSFAVYSTALTANVVNYVMTQIALGDDINFSIKMSIPFTNSFEPFLASTVSFAMLSMVILVLYFIARDIDEKSKANDPMKLIFIGGAIIILITLLMNIISLLPVFVRLIGEQLVL